VRGTLLQLIKLARERRLPRGWLHLPDPDPRASVECLFLDATLDLDDAEAVAAAEGFPYPGLETQTLEDTISWAEQMFGSPSDADLVDSFIYYWRFDAFLPQRNAPDPPPPHVTAARLDLEFIDALGQERPDEPCRHPGCERGAIRWSVLCRRHHFESIQRRPWPLAD
jgi:hypothetical protein